MKKGPDALVIDIGAEKPKEGDDEMAEAYGAESKDAAQALIDAIKAGDAGAVADAFSALKAVC